MVSLPFSLAKKAAGVLRLLAQQAPKRGLIIFELQENRCCGDRQGYSCLMVSFASCACVSSQWVESFVVHADLGG
jgi:hypothetical protein